VREQDTPVARQDLQQTVRIRTGWIVAVVGVVLEAPHTELFEAALQHVRRLGPSGVDPGKGHYLFGIARCDLAHGLVGPHDGLRSHALVTRVIHHADYREVHSSLFHERQETFTRRIGPCVPGPFHDHFRVKVRTHPPGGHEGVTDGLPEPFLAHTGHVVVVDVDDHFRLLSDRATGVRLGAFIWPSSETA